MEKEIKCIVAGSIADEIGLESGDCLLLINGKQIEDVFEYRFLCAEEEIEITVQKKDGQVWEIQIEKDEDEDLGIEFVNPLLTEEMHCTNKCIFCFIDQLPKGMRETLYFKDDDSRLSFLTGNYVTLTNMKDEDLDRIIKYRLSPINVSVHTTNPQLRIKMLNNRFAGGVLKQIGKIVDAGLTVNAQIVLCRGWNDGEELINTLTDLCKLHPGIGSISVVPVGITKYRENLHQLIPFDKVSAEATIDTIEKFQEKNLKKTNNKIVFAADEFYLMADREIPDFDAYEDFPQIENGVGLIAMLRQEINEVCKLLEGKKISEINKKVLIATGKAAEGFIREMALKLVGLFPGLEIQVLGVENKFFGEHVNVCGLLTGQDILNEVSNKIKNKSYDSLVLCSSMLRAGEEVFLDDMTLDELSDKLGININVSSNSGEDFVKTVTGINTIVI